MPKEKVIYLGECTKCWVWGIAPSHFSERLHFLVCPKCNGNMFLNRQTNLISNPLFNDKNKVEITNLRQAK